MPRSSHRTNPSNSTGSPPLTAEQQRLNEVARRQEHWIRWGPYLSERTWGTVREDYSPHGTAWESFYHDQARFRAYRWNEDGLDGISDRHQYLCFAIAVWNGGDPILKEGVFGLKGDEGAMAKRSKTITSISIQPRPIPQKKLNCSSHTDT